VDEVRRVPVLRELILDDLDELLDRLRAAGHAEASLRVFDENERAVRFYARRGWVATDVTSRSSFAPFPVLRRHERRLDDA
jgi:ribosomal protein S18 acetylase RimI-like enzyme